MKEKKSMFKGYVLGLLTALLVSMMVVPGFAATVAKTITVYTGITLYYDGVKVEPKDANGNKVEPLLYNGTTYLPVRAVSGLFDEDINWDGKTQSVYIGDMPGKKTYLKDLPFYESSSLSLPDTLTMDGKTYVNCFRLGDASITGNKEYVSWNLDGAYDTLEFDVGHIFANDTAKQVIVYLDGQPAKIIDIAAGDKVKHVKVDLNGALRLKIQVETGSRTGFGNAVLQ